MKKLLLILLCVTTHTFSQIKQDEKRADYTVTGSDTLTASRSITLKPTTWIKAGANFHAFIVEDAYLSLNLSNENYILTRVFQTGTTIGVVSKNKDVIEEVTYFDGLGRTKQSIGIKQSPNKKDIVTHIEYDEFGRQAKDFLPYGATVSGGGFNSSAKTATNNYYKTNYSSDIDALTPNPYSEKQFDGSPLNRVLKQAAPGEDWKLGKGHEVKFDYQTNTSGKVRVFGVTTTFADNTYTPTLTGGSSNYAAGELYKTVTKDENWTSGLDHTTEEFKNKQGQVILKRTYNEGQKHDTYYVYDDFGNLTYVLPPEAEAQTDKPTTIELNELCYQYVYDHRNRLVEKKIPGKGWEYIIYDKLDRPIWTQDKNQRDKTTKEWLFTKYDTFGRVVYTGKKNHERERTYLQNIITGPTSTYKQHESRGALRTIAGVNIYYTSDAAPTDIHDVYTINYYDDYNVDLPDGLGQTVTTSYGITSTSRTKGLATVSKVKVLGTNNWITAVTYYDKKARPIYVYSKNEELQTTDIVESKLDFSGKVLETKTTHKKSGKADIVTIDSFEYDHVGRMTKQTQKINSQDTEIIASNSYDELGQLKTKKVGGNLQTVDYTYNIRGWLKNINQDSNTTDNDLFNFTINYNKPQNGATPLFNGNISETHWNTLNVDTSTRGYSYKYDALNRLLSATGTPNTNYNVSGITYDKNGNIITLNRNGWQNSSSYANMDILSYEYHQNTNRLKNINDTGNANYGFKDGSELATEYTYDANGNMLTDANKNVTSVEYNHLNMPTEIRLNNSDSKKVKFVYAADGTKLRKVVNDNGTTTTTDYAEGFVYKNNVLKQFSHSEGYVEPNGSNYSYVYQYKDLQGNVRLSYTDSNKDGVITPSTEILREQNYYPFGLKHVGYNGSIIGVKNNIKQFQGQEYHEELGLKVNEFKYRFYDPAYGRFWSIDPLAEDFAYNATYAFAENKLGLGKELEGRELLNNQMLFEAIRLGYEGYQSIKNNFTGGVEKVSQAHNEQMRQKIGTPDPNFDSESNRIEMAIGAGQVSKAVTDSGHLVADVAGTVDPSGIVDGVHALTYLPSGKYGNAALTGMGMLAYLGDGAKLLKYSDNIANLVSKTGKLDGGKEIISVLKSGEDTLENGIKVAEDVIGGLGDDAVEKAGKFGSQNGVRVGSQSANGKKGWRVDYDAKKGGHINWWNGKEKGAIIIKAGQEQIDQIIKNQTF